MNQVDIVLRMRRARRTWLLIQQRKPFLQSFPEDEGGTRRRSKEGKKGMSPCSCIVECVM